MRSCCRFRLTSKTIPSSNSALIGTHRRSIRAALGADDDQATGGVCPRCGSRIESAQHLDAEDIPGGNLVEQCEVVEAGVVEHHAHLIGERSEEHTAEL